MHPLHQADTLLRAPVYVRPSPVMGGGPSGVEGAVGTWRSGSRHVLGHRDPVKGVHSGVRHPSAHPARWPPRAAVPRTCWSLPAKRDGRGGGPSLGVRLQRFVLVCLQVSPEQTW